MVWRHKNLNMKFDIVEDMQAGRPYGYGADPVINWAAPLQKMAKDAYETLSPYSPPAHKLAGYATEAAFDYMLPPFYSKIANKLSSYVPWTYTVGGKGYARHVVHRQVSKWLKSRRLARRAGSYVSRATSQLWRASRRRRRFSRSQSVRRRTRSARRRPSYYHIIKHPKRQYGVRYSRPRSSSSYF